MKREHIILATAVACGAVASMPSLSWAQALIAEAQQVSTWALTLVKALAVCFIIAGFIAFASGHARWAGGLGMAIGIIGAAKADQIAAMFGLG